MQSIKDDTRLVDLVRAAARPLDGGRGDHDPLLDLIGDARFVLLGEASHGTHEFYRERARITQRLITERGFCAVAIEGDWPDAYRVNRYVRGGRRDAGAAAALSGFERFPGWMWRNTDVVDFVAWLRAHNDAQRAPQAEVGFYGLDLYSMNSSMAAVLSYLDSVDPAAAQRARRRYACFDHFDHDTRTYGLMARLGAGSDCEEAVIGQLLDLQRHAAQTARDQGADADAQDEAFQAEQNARLVRNAERYYRSMYLSDVSSWNLRDGHMVETLEALVEHLDRRVGRAKVVVWAHNSHLGDARATEMGELHGESNVGQLVRQRHGGAAVLVGFTTHDGSVTAASDWDAPAERKAVVASRDDSFEGVFHASGIDRFLLPIRGDAALAAALRKPRLERAIGVIYRPQTERQSHYFDARLGDQFDAVLHFDRTRALEPLEPGDAWQAVAANDEAPETYPSGL